MTTIEQVKPKSLTEVKGKIGELAREAEGIFAAAGPELKMGIEQVERVQAINAELGDLNVLKGQYEDVEKIRASLMIEAGYKASDAVELGLEGGRHVAGMTAKRLGELFVESVAVKQFDRTSRRGPAAEIDAKGYFEALAERKALMSTTSGFAPQVVRSGLIVPTALQRPTVADLIPQGTTDQAAYSYMEETTATNGADAVAEGGTKPESALAFTERQAPVRKLATVLPVTEEQVADVRGLQAYIEARLMLFLQIKEEAELLAGSGTAPHLTGLANVAGVLTQARGTDPGPDAIFKAITKIAINSYLDADGVVMHPTDWQNIRLLRTADGIYIFGSPSEVGPARLWGLPIVATTAQTAGTAIVAAFQTAMMILRRLELAFAISDQHADFFITNKLMLRVEERLAFPVFRPSGVCLVSGL